MKKANPTTLGLFLVIGVVLGVAGVLVFSAGTFFRPEMKNILYFNGSLKGLNPGAPVKYRGVTIGRVEQILIRHNQSDDDFAMPVIIAVDEKLAQSKSDQRLRIRDPDKFNLLVHQGFRGRLDAESLVTGVLYVSLDIVPDAPPPVFHQIEPQYREIPTVPSQVQKLLANLEHLDLPGLSARLEALLDKADASLGELHVDQINSGLTNLLGSANHLVTSPDLTNAVLAARHSLEHADALLQRVDGRVNPLADDLTNTLADAQKTLVDLRQGIQNISGLVGPDATFQSDLSQALEQLANASRSVADLAEFLERNPDALITGRKRSGNQQ